MKQTASHWVPAMFCAFLCTFALIGGIAGVVGGGQFRWWEVAFYAFLPMCFVYAGFIMADLRRQIQELRDQLAAVQGERPLPGEN